MPSAKSASISECRSLTNSFKGRTKGATGQYCAVGRIEYKRVDGAAAEDGTLIYIKPAICGNEPRDVASYREQSQNFPHESTADQFFTESQFESYRALGSHVLDEICGPEWEASPGQEIEGFLLRLKEYSQKVAERSGRLQNPASRVNSPARSCDPH